MGYLYWDSENLPHRLKTAWKYSETCLEWPPSGKTTLLEKNIYQMVKVSLRLKFMHTELAWKDDLHWRTTFSQSFQTGIQHLWIIFCNMPIVQNIKWYGAFIVLGMFLSWTLFGDNVRGWAAKVKGWDICNTPPHSQHHAAQPPIKQG